MAKHRGFSTRESRRFARLVSCGEITRELDLYFPVKVEPGMEIEHGKEVVKVEAGMDSDRGKEVPEMEVDGPQMEVDLPEMEVDGPQMEVDGPQRRSEEIQEVSCELVPEVLVDGGMPVTPVTVVTDEMFFLDEFQAGDEIDLSNVEFDARDDVDYEKLEFDFKDLDVSEMPDLRDEIDDEDDEADEVAIDNSGKSALVELAATAPGENSTIAQPENLIGIVQCRDNSVGQPVGSSCDVMSFVEMSAPGFRQVPDADLVRASKGEDKPKSLNNDRWALRRVDTLRRAMGWDMTIPFGDLPFDQIDILLSNLFARVVKVKGGGTYPASSLMNMLGGYNRVIRQASIARTLRGVNKNVVDRGFQIKNHPEFTRTRLTLKAALQKGQKEGANKNPVKKVTVVSVAMEEALFADLEHQLTDNRGCQKLLAILLLLRVGIRGGDELWLLDRDCLSIEVDNHGREYVKFEERGSKNNCVTTDRYQPEQFRKAYHSYEERFVMCVKQYKRHLPPLAEGTKPDLFLGCITNPVGNIWFIRTSKVGKETAHKWLKNALQLVGIPGELISNKSGHATLITRLAASGVPDEVGRLVSGHHTLSGYSRYDRTQPLKMEAAQLCTFNPGMDYEMALTKVSEKFKEEQLVGSSANLQPLIDRSERAQELQLALRSELNITEVPNNLQVQVPNNLRVLLPASTAVMSEKTGDSSCSRLVTLKDSPKDLAAWHKGYDGIDWDAAMARDPVLARALGGRYGATMNNLGGNTFSNLSNCTIQICVGQPADPSKDENKENIRG